MNPVQKFFATLLGVKPQVETRYPLDQDAIRANEQIKGLAQKLAATETQLAKILADKRDEDLKKKEDELEEDYVNRLNEQKAEIKDNDYGKPVSLMAAFKLILFNKKFREAFEICDREDKTVFGKFGDILVSKGGKLIITDTEGNILSRGSTLHHIIYKPDSLLNQIRRKRLLLPLNENGEYVPDIEEMEAPNVSYNEETGEVDEATEHFRPVKDMLVEKEQKIVELRGELELHENAIAKLRTANADLKRSIKLYENQKDTHQTELSKAMDASMQIHAKMGDLQRQIVSLTEAKATNEKIISSMETIQATLIKKVEDMGVKGDFDKVIEQVKELMEWAKDNTPEVIHKYEAPQEKPMEAVQPGQRLK